MEGLTLASILPLLAGLTVMGIMFSLGLNLHFREIFELWRKPGLLAKSILAVVIIVPLLSLAVILIFNLPPMVEIAIMIMAVVPGAPLATRRATRAGGELKYSAALQFTVNIIAIITVPFFLYVLSTLFVPDAYASPLVVARQVAMVQFVPLILGILIGTFWSTFADRFSGVIDKTAFIALAVLVVIIGLGAWREFFDVLAAMGWLSFIVMFVIILISLLLGHLLGGPERENRITLAVVTIVRNAGLAIFLIMQNFPGQGLLGVVVVYIVIGLVVQAVYSAIMKKSNTDRSDTPAEIN